MHQILHAVETYRSVAMEAQSSENSKNSLCVLKWKRLDPEAVRMR